MGIPLETVPYYDNGGGVDLKSSATKVDEDTGTQTLNIDYTTDGAFATRPGSFIVNRENEVPQQIAGAPRGLLFFDYRKSTGLNVQILAAGTDLYHNYQAPVAQGFNFSALLPIPDMEFFVTRDNEYMIWGNGIDDNLKFNGVAYTPLSIAAPATALVAAEIDVGVGNLGAGDYQYYYTFARIELGVIVQESPISGVSNTLNIPVGPSNVDLTGFLAPTDPQVTHWVVYRISPTSGGIAYRHLTIDVNQAPPYEDDILDDGTIEADFDEGIAPKSAIFEAYERRMYYVDASRTTDLYYSAVDSPWNVDVRNFIIFDGPITCLVRCFGALIIGTDRSLWVLNGDIENVEPRRVSSKIGIINNRCAGGETNLYIFATNKKVYSLGPTDFSQDEIRLDNPLSTLVDPFIGAITNQNLPNITAEYFTRAEEAKFVISVPIQITPNDHLLIYNETQSIAKGKPVWQIWNNLNAAAIETIVIAGEPQLFIADFNGFIWEIDAPFVYGDGAEINGTATGGTAATLIDTTQNWIVNQFVGMKVRIIDGTGVNQFKVIISNTADTLTISTGLTDWTVVPDDTSEYTIGGYDVYHYTNWKYVLSNYDMMKQLWFLFINANANGDYAIEVVLQFNFITTDEQSIFIDFNLKANNSIWGQFIWGMALWGGQAVFNEKLGIGIRFYSIRLGFRNREAGQPFQINGFTIGSQNKGLFYAP